MPIYVDETTKRKFATAPAMDSASRSVRVGAAEACHRPQADAGGAAVFSGAQPRLEPARLRNGGRLDGQRRRSKFRDLARPCGLAAYRDDAPRGFIAWSRISKSLCRRRPSPEDRGPPHGFRVSQLLRALIIEAATFERGKADAYTARVTTLILDQLRRAEPVRFSLPWPSSPSIAELCDALYGDPLDLRGLVQWERNWHVGPYAVPPFRG